MAVLPSGVQDGLTKYKLWLIDGWSVIWKIVTPVLTSLKTFFSDGYTLPFDIVIFPYLGNYYLLLWFCKEGKRQKGDRTRGLFPLCHLAPLPSCHSRYKRSIIW
jgi:hypothetical protein